jgi:hypothetical protein
LETHPRQGLPLAGGHQQHFTEFSDSAPSLDPSVEMNSWCAMDVCWSEPQGILLKLGIDGLLSNLFRFQVKYRDMYKSFRKIY